MSTSLDERRGHDGASSVPLRLFLLLIVLVFDRALQAFHLFLWNYKGVTVFAHRDLVVRSSLGFPNLVIGIDLGIPVDKLVVLTVVNGVNSLGCHWHLRMYQVCC